VRELILDVTEAMAGETNPDAVSLRAIAREANVAPRALSYHFATKRSLLEAVVRRRSEVISKNILDRLEALGAWSGEVSVRAVVEAVLLPIVELIEREPVGGVRWMRVFSTLSRDDDPTHVVEVGFDPEVARRYFELVEQASGVVRDQGLRRRAELGMLSMLEALSRVDQPIYGLPLRGDRLDPEFVHQLIIFTSAGIAGHI
jgi:AcrR family transcriptional regulator